MSIFKSIFSYCNIAVLKECLPVVFLCSAPARGVRVQALTLKPHMRDNQQNSESTSILALQHWRLNSGGSSWLSYRAIQLTGEDSRGNLFLRLQGERCENINVQQNLACFIGLHFRFMECSG